MYKPTIRKRYRTRVVKNKIPGGWVGMNWYAANELGVPYKHNRDVVLVWSGAHRSSRDDIARHERIEAEEMRRNRLKYHEAHKIALKFEDDTSIRYSKKK